MEKVELVEAFMFMSDVRKETVFIIALRTAHIVHYSLAAEAELNLTEHGEIRDGQK